MNYVHSLIYTVGSDRLEVVVPYSDKKQIWISHEDFHKRTDIVLNIPEATKLYNMLGETLNFCKNE